MIVIQFPREFTKTLKLAGLVVTTHSLHASPQVRYAWRTIEGYFLGQSRQKTTESSK
jgi:hypothetical protein